MSSCLDENTLLDFLASSSAREDASVLQHIGTCDACRDWLATMATMMSTAEDGAPPTKEDGAPLAAFESRFLLGSILGSGGMGVVWGATDLSTGSEVAIKLVPTPDGVLRRRTLREARIRKLVTHPHLLLVHDQFETLRGDLALVMKRLHGEDLAAKLARVGPLPFDAARALLWPIADALVAVHGAGLVHRDVKPQNIFLEACNASTATSENTEAPAEKSWLLDFGMAKVMQGLSLSSTAGALTAEKTVLGTPHYMAPEQLYGEPDVGPAADVWAFAVVLFETLSGVRSVPGKSFGQVFHAVTTGNLRSLADVAPELPSSVHAFVHRLLAQDARERPSMADAKAELERL